MSIKIKKEVFIQIQQHGEAAYPEEGAGLLLGRVDGEERFIEAILALENSREDEARHNRYLITAQDMLHGEKEAAAQGLDVIGVFHSHPDHPDQPSEFDREWALPWFSYIITSVQKGQATSSHSWRLLDDRSSFEEEPIQILEEETLLKKE
ncbi:MAG: hypothetical protein DWQ07_14365 [Chloroflexi bacterium]|nr:MAG: hypothetical protein DWQ07_14365 [Chloroflexota bacterium]MBL1195733.1 M67 family peptidase [Chloroflexota bacterium]NOH13021.1 M67 family metallopeptidase [Chloroflexota bacterium]